MAEFIVSEVNSMGLFSKRNKVKNSGLSYDFPLNVRDRIMHTLAEGLRNDMNAFGQGVDLVRVFEGAARKALTEYGTLHNSRHYSTLFDAAAEHFRTCPDENALDFLEMIFGHDDYFHWLKTHIESVNRVFQDEQIGYELTPLRETITDEPGHVFGRPSGRVIRREYPKVIRRDTEYAHKEIIQPCLEALGRPGLETALSEMMKAHEAYRKGQYADAITDVGAAFESTFKTICDKKNWQYNADKDTLSQLVKICNTNNLFPPFYAPIFEAVGTIRNKMSDAHGRGPKPLYAVEKVHADHMLQMASAHITFLLKLANI